jgi:hypothetical protein
MMRLAAVVVVVIAVPVMPATTQERPTFAGTWMVAVGQGPQPPEQPRFIGFGKVFTVSQDGKTLRVTRELDGGDSTAVYYLDGSESRNLARLGGTDVEHTSRIRWEGSTLVVVTTTAPKGGGRPSEGTLSMSIDAAGYLVLEAIAPWRAVLRYERLVRTP